MTSTSHQPPNYDVSVFLQQASRMQLMPTPGPAIQTLSTAASATHGSAVAQHVADSGPSLSTETPDHAGILITTDDPQARSFHGANSALRRSSPTRGCSQPPPLTRAHTMPKVKPMDAKQRAQLQQRTIAELAKYRDLVTITDAEGVSEIVSKLRLDAFFCDTQPNNTKSQSKGKKKKQALSRPRTQSRPTRKQHRNQKAQNQKHSNKKGVQEPVGVWVKSTFASSEQKAPARMTAVAPSSSHVTQETESEDEPVLLSDYAATHAYPLPAGARKELPADPNLVICADQDLSDINEATLFPRRPSVPAVYTPRGKRFAHARHQSDSLLVHTHASAQTANRRSAALTSSIEASVLSTITATTIGSDSFAGSLAKAGPAAPLRSSKSDTTSNRGFNAGTTNHYGLADIYEGETHNSGTTNTSPAISENKHPLFRPHTYVAPPLTVSGRPITRMQHHARAATDSALLSRLPPSALFPGSTPVRGYLDMLTNTPDAPSPKPLSHAQRPGRSRHATNRGRGRGKNPRSTKSEKSVASDKSNCGTATKVATSADSVGFFTIRRWGRRWVEVTENHLRVYKSRKCRMPLEVIDFDFVTSVHATNAAKTPKLSATLSETALNTTKDTRCIPDSASSVASAATASEVGPIEFGQAGREFSVRVESTWNSRREFFFRVPKGKSCDQWLDVLQTRVRAASDEWENCQNSGVIS